MAKLKAKPASRAKSRRKSTGVKMMRDASTGEFVYVIDEHSKTLGQDLLDVFRKYVRAARRENLKLLGSADGVQGGR